MGAYWGGVCIATSSTTAVHAPEALNADLGIPATLRDWGIGEADRDRLVDGASKVTRLLDNNPRPRPSASAMPRARPRARWRRTARWTTASRPAPRWWAWPPPASADRRRARPFRSAGASWRQCGALDATPGSKDGRGRFTPRCSACEPIPPVLQYPWRCGVNARRRASCLPARSCHSSRVPAPGPCTCLRAGPWPPHSLPPWSSRRSR